MEVDSGFRFLASGLVWGSDYNRAREGVRPSQGEHLSLNRCGKHFGHTNKLEGEIRNDILVQ